jgi:hypothetical protein
MAGLAFGGNAERPQGAGADLRVGDHGRDHEQLHLAGQRGLQGGPAAAVGHVGDLEIAELLQERGGDVGEGADARCRVVDGVRCPLRGGNQLLESVPGRALLRGEDERTHRHQAHGREGLHHLVGQAHGGLVGGLGV